MLSSGLSEQGFLGSTEAVADIPLPALYFSVDGDRLIVGQMNRRLARLLEINELDEVFRTLGADAVGDLIAASERAGRSDYAVVDLQLDGLLWRDDPRANQRAFLSRAASFEGFVAVFVDIGSEFALESLLSDQASSFKALLEAQRQGIVIADTNNTVIYANRLAEELTGSASGGMVGVPLAFGVSESGAQEIDFSALVGHRLFARVLSTPIRWLGLDARVITITDVTMFHDAEHQVRQAALQDSLTGLANREALIRHVSLHMPHQEGQALALLLINVHRFAQFNTRYGADKGDTLLKKLAVALQRAVPPQPGVLLARLGADNFAVVGPCAADIDIARQQSVDILARLHRALEANSEYQAIALYGALALAPLHASSAPELLECVSLTMQSARAERRARGVVVADLQSMRRFEVRASLESQLSEAMIRGQFSVCYQPLIRMADWSLTGFEALVRWNHPGRGLLTPASFIEQMGHMGLLNALGLDVLRMVCEQMARWSARGYPRCSVSVNLAPEQLMVPDLAESMMYIIDMHGVSPADITFELTESGFLEDFDQALSTLTALKAAGFSLALDDFGTGYSSLSHLRTLPVDYVKIDRSFVGKLPDSASDLALVRAVVEMSHALGMVVVSEGIETPAQVEAVCRAGVDVLQGYFWDRPLTAEQAEQHWLCGGSQRIAQLRSALIGAPAAKPRAE